MEESSRSKDKALREIRAFIKSTQQDLKRARGLNEEVRVSLQAKLNELRQLVEAGDVVEAGEKMEEVQQYVATHLPDNGKGAWREYFESIALAVLCALLLRGFVVEAFKIPTGSMIPTLLVGDHLFVNKFVYGIRVPFTKKYLVEFSKPEKGEVVVFSFPAASARAHIAKQPASRRNCIDQGSLKSEKDFIKRIIGVEGDTVEVRDNQLFVNNVPTERTFLRKEATGEFLYPHEMHEQETLNGYRYTIHFKGSDENFGPITVEPGHFFVMGDNRDQSSDSRCWGQVPVENIKGRAMIIWWSIGPDAMRWDRIGRFIH